MNKRHSNARLSKIFAKGDIIVYIALVVLIVVLFIVIWGIKGESSLESIDVYHNESLVLRYDPQDKSYRISKDYSDLVVVNKFDTYYTFTIYTDKEKKHYNEFTINDQNVCTMVNANCSTRKDCAHSPSIKMDKDIIICAPHKIKIVGVGSGEISPEINV